MVNTGVRCLCSDTSLVNAVMQDKSARGGWDLYQHYGNNVINSAYVLFFSPHLCNDNDGGERIVFQLEECDLSFLY